MHKLLLGRDPVTGDALASQPTLSRFENDVTRGDLLALSEALFETVLDRHRRRRRRVRRITLDLDVTDDPTHAAPRVLQRVLQQLVLPAAAGVPSAVIENSSPV